MSKKTWTARIYLGRDHEGKQRFHWVGRGYETKRERDAAIKAEERRLEEEGCNCEHCVEMGRFQMVRSDLPACDLYVERYLADYARRWKDSSAKNRAQGLKRFKEDFAGKSLAVPRQEMKDYVYGEGRWEARGPLPRNDVASISAMYTHAVEEDDMPLKRDPSRGLVQSTKGRSEHAPPTEEEFKALADACATLGPYGPKFRALFEFATYELMRPSECYALKWQHIDFERMRVRKAKRLYEGAEDDPKTGPKLIALTPPAKQAITGLARTSEYVFTTKTGKRMSQASLSRYWDKVRGASGLEFDFYHATKHFGVWFYWTQKGMSERAIAAQAGWSLKSIREILELLEIYGHGDVGALEEVDAAFQQQPVTQGLRVIDGGVTQS